MTADHLQSGFVQVETANRVLRITLNRADKRNALTRAMYEDLGRAIEYGAAADDVRVIQIDAAGDMFCAGNDIADFAAADPNSADAGPNGPALRFIRRMADCDKPIVAGVQGQATGIGTTLLLHADLIVAADNARFYTAFIDLGLVPEAGSSLLLPALIGRQNAARLLLAGDSFDAREAEAMGLIAYRVPANELAEQTAKLSGRLADKPPGAMAASKRLLRDGANAAALSDQIAREAEIFGQRLVSDEVREIMNAFLARKRA